MPNLFLRSAHALLRASPGSTAAQTQDCYDRAGPPQIPRPWLHDIYNNVYDGFKKSSVSRRWIKATANKIDELQKRSLVEMDIRAVFIDGKRFRKHGVIVALGMASDGRKFVLGIYQADSENHESCLELLNDLEKRGLPATGLLFMVLRLHSCL